MGVIQYGLNHGPDGKHYPFGWLGEEHRIGDFYIVETRVDRNSELPDDYAVFRIDPATREVYRDANTWATLNEALIAIVMRSEGVNVNTIAHTVPLLMHGIKGAAQDD